VLAADETHVSTFSSAMLGEQPAAWKFAPLRRKQPTTFTVVDLGEAHVLKVEAEDSYGNLVHGLHMQVTEHSVLAWPSRIDKPIVDADLTTRAGDDSLAKACVFCAFNADKLSLGERTGLSVA
jgi:hypothetical protein